jgi:hypothetical protein
LTNIGDPTPARSAMILHIYNWRLECIKIVDETYDHCLLQHM